jgi:transposase
VAQRSSPMIWTNSRLGLFKTRLQYKGQQAGRSVIIVSERDSTRTCSNCKALTGPTGLDSACGVTHDRDVNSARNHRSAGRSSPSVSGNELSLAVVEPSQTSSRCEARTSALKAVA